MGCCVLASFTCNICLGVRHAVLLSDSNHMSVNDMSQQQTAAHAH